METLGVGLTSQKHGGSVTIDARDFNATVSHLGRAAEHISTSLRTKLTERAKQHPGKPQTKPLQIGGRIYSAQASKSIAIKQAKLTITYEVTKTGTLEISEELSVDRNVKLKNGRSVNLATSITTTVEFARKPRDKDRRTPTPVRVPVREIVRDLEKALLFALIAYGVKTGVAALKGFGGAPPLEAGESSLGGGIDIETGD